MNIILAHGMFGFKERFGIEYFGGVAERLRRLPANVVVTEVSPTAAISARGEELRGQILAAFRDGTLDPSQKAHIIAHSMGGLDSRFILSPSNKNTTRQNDLSHRIASLTTISTPHRGSLIADLLAPKAAGHSAPVEHLMGIIDRLGAPKGLPEEILSHFGISFEGLKDLTTSFLQKFDREYGDHPGIKYFSVAGAGRPAEPRTAVLLYPFYLYIKSHTGEPNDGLVTVPSARWGEFDPDLWPCDHAEEIGHDLDHPLRSTRFEYLDKYEVIARRACSAG